MNSTIKYRRGYKYQLAETYHLQTDILPGKIIDTEFIRLSDTGLLTISAGYAWDGASGPTLDTPSSMRGSLVHDALYQLMRDGLLDKVWRKRADEILMQCCIADGMDRARAWLWYQAVRRFAGYAASTHNKTAILMAPR